MAKSSSVFVCQNCEASFPRWSGQCSDCGEWNTLVETMAAPQAGGKKAKARSSKFATGQSLVKFSEVKAVKGTKQRLSTQIGELDRVLGQTLTGRESSAGLVDGMVVLMGGEPGIGKSTLLTQVAINIVASQTDGTGGVLYVCGEESPSQISLRINRILDFADISSEKLQDKLMFATSADVDEVVSMIDQHRPLLVIVDSIQAMFTTDLNGASGSVGQIREATDRISNVVKALGIPTFLVGHVTKDGVIAGPKVLEHMVDTVLELSGERTGQFRFLRAIKNRFGATDEVGVFQVVDWGIKEVTDPTELFLEHASDSVPGSATVCVLEGTRPLLIEVQALVVKSHLAMPRRVGRGIELSRIQVLAAVLQKHVKLPLGSYDIFLSAAGGFKVREPAVDLGLAVAVASSLKSKSISGQTIFIGEVGLLGEIRSVNYLDRRIKEAKRLGFKRIISRHSHRSIGQVLQELGLSSAKT